jgi:serine/threonine protein kinase
VRGRFIAAACAAGEFDVRAKLTDFGVSNVLRLTKGVRVIRGAACGTLAFMPPELVHPPHAVSAKTDVWSFGMMLWELWTRQVPFAGLMNSEIMHRIGEGNLPEWPEGTPPLLVKLSARCWQHVRFRRCDPFRSARPTALYHGPFASSSAWQTTHVVMTDTRRTACRNPHSAPRCSRLSTS